MTSALKLEGFRLEMARCLDAIPYVHAVYYVGLSMWEPAFVNFGKERFILNFLVRTDRPAWAHYSPGTANAEPGHYLFNQIPEVLRLELLEKWSKEGFCPGPDDESTQNPERIVRIVQAPAGDQWVGQDQLSSVENGFSVENLIPLGFLRYESTEAYGDVMTPVRRVSNESLLVS